MKEEREEKEKEREEGRKRGRKGGREGEELIAIIWTQKMLFHTSNSNYQECLNTRYENINM